MPPESRRPEWHYSGEPRPSARGRREKPVNLDEVSKALSTALDNFNSDELRWTAAAELDILKGLIDKLEANHSRLAPDQTEMLIEAKERLGELETVNQEIHELDTRLLDVEEQVQLVLDEALLDKWLDNPTAPLVGSYVEQIKQLHTLYVELLNQLGDYDVSGTELDRDSDPLLPALEELMLGLDIPLSDIHDRLTQIGREYMAEKQLDEMYRQALNLLADNLSSNKELTENHDLLLGYYQRVSLLLSPTSIGQARQDAQDLEQKISHLKEKESMSSADTVYLNGLQDSLLETLRFIKKAENFAEHDEPKILQVIAKLEERIASL